MDASRPLPLSGEPVRTPCLACLATVLAYMVGATIAMIATSARLAQAQPQPRTVTTLVAGVADAGTGQGLEGAELLLPELRLTARSDAIGEIRLAGIPVGVYRVRVRLLGYTAADTRLAFTGDTTSVVFRLQRTVVSLDRVEVRGEQSARLRDFDTRRRQAIGKFLTSAELEKDAHRDFGVVAMSRFPGLRLVHDGDGRPHIASARGSCGVALSRDEVIIPLSRAGGSGGRGTAATGGSSTAGTSQGAKGTGTSDANLSGATPVATGSCVPSKPCLVQMYLDDILLEDADFDIIDTWDLAGVEYYTGAGMPARYRVSGSACGVMLLWSK